MTANFIAITLGKSWYPFYDVGMFRWSTPYQNRDKIMYQLKYYYWQNGQYKILDLRKEGNFFLADHFGLGYAENFMFSAAYRYRGKRKTLTSWVPDEAARHRYLMGRHTCGQFWNRWSLIWSGYMSCDPNEWDSPALLWPYLYSRLSDKQVSWALIL